MLWQVLEAMRALHATLDNLLGDLSRFPDRIPELARYDGTVGRYSALFATTPELGSIYADIACHLGAVELLAEICRDRAIPSWDVVADVNAAAEAVTEASGRYLLRPVPAPASLRNRVPTIADRVASR